MKYTKISNLYSSGNARIEHAKLLAHGPHYFPHQALVAEPEDHIKAACAWSLGQIGRHTPDHARALAEGDVLRHLLVRGSISWAPSTIDLYRDGARLESNGTRTETRHFAFANRC